jgi:MFS family permease
MAIDAQAQDGQIAGNSSRQGTITTDIPARMDRLPWSRFHWLVVIALGITWILDGLEVTIVGAVGSVLTTKSALNLTSGQVGLAGSIYILGAVAGALTFGYLTDRLGRKKLFMITLGVYLIATAATAFSMNFIFFAACRFFTGAGIGGEYSAINSAIDELIPARVRGWTDLAINGSYWIGTIIGSVATIFLLNPHILPTWLGWRVAFAFGPILAIGILLVRRYVPESPRWLMIHGRMDEARQVVSNIEGRVKDDDHLTELPKPDRSITLRPRPSVGFLTIGKVMFRQYPQRSVLGFSLMTGQAFLYNAIFFTYALVLKTFYHVPGNHVGYYLIAFAVGNVLGPLTIGRLFDTIGRRQMISFTYILSGVMLGITAWIFNMGMLTAVTQTIAWSAIFFFASAGASSAYLTVSEVFPLETRAMAIAFFYSIGTAAGGITGPVLFGSLIGTGSRTNLFYGYLIGAALMAAAGVVEIFFGVKAERESLENIANPLSAETGLEPQPAGAGGASAETPATKPQVVAPAAEAQPAGAHRAQSAAQGSYGRVQVDRQPDRILITGDDALLRQIRIEMPGDNMYRPQSSSQLDGQHSNGYRREDLPQDAGQEAAPRR